jgi:hypothetical protein
MKDTGGEEVVVVEATVEIARWETLTANDQVTQISINKIFYKRYLSPFFVYINPSTGSAYPKSIVFFVSVAGWFSLEVIVAIAAGTTAGITTHIKSQAATARVFEPHDIVACSSISCMIAARRSLELRGAGNLSPKSHKNQALIGNMIGQTDKCNTLTFHQYD